MENGGNPVKGTVKSDVAADHRRMMVKLLTVATIMFGFGWAMVPLYRVLCEITGINVLTDRDEEAAQFAKNTQVDTSRRITVEFDANGRGPWRFVPRQNSVEVHPGELVTVVYEITNTQSRASAGQAIPSYAPEHSGPYFRKLECFCFKQQAFAPNEVREFPVVFVVDPKLPKDVNTITLSYTFFDIAGPVGAPQVPQTVPALPGRAS